MASGAEAVLGRRIGLCRGSGRGGALESSRPREEGGDVIGEDTTRGARAEALELSDIDLP